MPENPSDLPRFDLRQSLDEGLGAPAPAPRQAPRARKRWSRPLIAGVIVGALVLVVALVYLVDLLRTKDQIAQGQSVNGVAVGGLTPAEAEAAVVAAGVRFTAPITVTALGRQESLVPSEIGLSVDIAGTVASLGVRSANPFDRIASFGRDENTPLRLGVDRDAVEKWLESLAGADDVAAVEGSVTIEGTEVVVVEPVQGEHLDIEAATDLISTAWLAGDPRSLAGVDLPEDEEGVRASPEGVASAAELARQVLSGPLTVKAGDVDIEIDVATIAAATTITPDDKDSFTVTTDPEPIRAAAVAGVAETNTGPTDASLAMTAEGPVITPSTDGRTANLTATFAALEPALSGDDRVLNVVYAPVPPETSTADIEALGIKEEISSFTTGGFAYDSGQNVKRTAEIVDGAIVMPGETFSLNTFTGPRGLDQGFVEAGIIQEGVASRAVGGGISQFATTLYNAGYFAGVQDVEHKAHSFYISRYPEGREATVFQNPDGSSVIDVAFTNTSDTAIWIQAIWTESDITVRFWGTKTVEVESITGERYDYTAAPSKTVPFGQSCSPSDGTSGFSVDNTRIIRDLDGKEISRETTSTSYNGQQATICEPPPPTTEAEPPPGSGEPVPPPADGAPPAEGAAPPADGAAPPTDGVAALAN